MNKVRGQLLLMVIVLLMVTFAWAQPVREFSGTFRYMADAAVFESCDGVSRPVAMQAGYLDLERRYLQTASGGEAVFVRLRGRLVVLPNMEDRPEEFVEVIEVLELDPTQDLAACRARFQPDLHEGYWRLTEIVGFEKDFTRFERLPYVTFRREDGVWRVSGYAGCNGISALYLTRDMQLLVGNLVLTEMACLGEQGALEAAFIGVLAKVDSHTIDGQDLTLFEDDTTLARFTFSPDQPSP